MLVSPTTSSSVLSLLYPTRLGVPGTPLTTPSADAYTRSKIAAMQTLSAFLGTANALAKPLVSSATSGAFQARSATSSDPAISATVMPAATLATYKISVTALAQGQQIKSNNLASTATSVAAGSYSFSVTTGHNGSPSTTTAVSVTVAAGDTNLMVMQKLAKAINGAKTGASASVVTDAAGNARIQLSHDSTGTGATLAVADAAAGGILSQVGLTATGTATATTGGTSLVAQNAAYTVNGTALTSLSNTLRLDNGKLTLTLSKVTTAAATVTVGADTPSVTSTVSSFISAYNQAVSYATSNTSTLPAHLVSELKQFATRNATDLASIGITAKKDGTLAMDSAAFAKALQADPNRVARIFGDPVPGGPRAPGGGFASSFQALATQTISALGVQSSSLQAQSTTLLLQQQRLASSSSLSLAHQTYLNALFYPQSIYSLLV